MALTKEKVFTEAQLEYLSEAYFPKTIDYYFPLWLAAGNAYIANWIDVEKENEDSLNSLLTLFILYKAHSTSDMAAFGEEIRKNLNENLKAVAKRQQRDKNKTVGQVVFKGDILSEFSEFDWSK